MNSETCVILVESGVAAVLHHLSYPRCWRTGWCDSLETWHEYTIPHRSLTPDQETNAKGLIERLCHYLPVRRSRACPLDRVDEPQGGWTWGVGASTQRDAMTGPDKPATHAHVTRLVVASPTCHEQPSPHGFDGALTLREQAGSAASCDPSCRRCAPWPFMIVRSDR